MKKTLFILLAFFVILSSYAQLSLNDYKYIIVPEKFEFLKTADEYRLNSLTKFLFEKYNFEPIMENEIVPSDYAKNNCLALKADVLKDSNLFKTKLTVQLKNCKNEVIFTSSQGESRDKSYKVAYNEALRLAFKSFEEENYSYNSKNEITLEKEEEVLEIVEEKQVEIDKLKEEVKQLKNSNATKVIEVKETESIAFEEEEKQEVVEAVPLVTEEVSNSRFLAEAIPDSAFGYFLIDSESNKRYTILFSGKEDFYIVKDKDAVVYKLNNKWVIAEVKGKVLEVKAIDIKF
ncbi:MAG: hypothetical protein QNK89_09375 [Lacinutrix sp.]|uniref:hypothetical protein n=1 Tax=Lacinutrix sp. TaxID=1937692 RepID=UPI00309FB319